MFQPAMVRIRGMAGSFLAGYANLKIKHKLFLIHCLIVMLLCLVSLAALQAALHVYDGLLYNESAKVLNLSTINIENELKKIEQFSSTIIANPDIQDSLEKLKTGPSRRGDPKVGSGITDILWVYAFERNIASVNLIDTRGNQFSGGLPIPGPLARRIVAEAVRKEGVLTFAASDPDSSMLFGARLVRRIRNLSLEPLGTLILRIKLGELVKQGTLGAANYKVNLLILDGKKEIYHSNQSLKMSGRSFALSGDAGYQVQNINGRNFFIAHTYSAFTGWTYVNILPYENIFQRIILLRTAILLIFLILFLSTIIISLKLAQNLTKPIETLTAAMKQAESGDFGAIEWNGSDLSRADEIGDLQRDFKMMVQKIDSLIQENYAKQLAVKEAQYRALQAQINPHFLYNTLESINWLAKVNRQPEISRMVESLGNLLRNAINNKQSITTLGEELQLLEDYVLIQKVRFGARLEIEIEIDPKWHGLPIPKLTLQPLLENSIHYGLEAMLEACRITVRSVVRDDCLEIWIEDNGPGIDPEILRKLETGQIKPQGSGIGLSNINDRLRRYFGEKYGLEVLKGRIKGTGIIIRIPWTEGADR